MDYDGNEVEVIVLIDPDHAYKKDNAFEIMLMSESSLAKDWLRPEEDEAWKDL